MIAIFRVILSISIDATIVAAVIILMKKIFANKLNTRISYLLWIPLLLRLLFPVLPASPVSIFNFTSLVYENNISNQLSSQLLPSTPVQNDTRSGVTTVKPDLNNNSSTPVEVHTPTKLENNYSESILKILAYIWLCGVVIIIAYLIYVNLIFSMKIKSMKTIVPPNEVVEKLLITTRIHKEATEKGLRHFSLYSTIEKWFHPSTSCPIKFVESPATSSPFVFGTIRPVIILPEGLIDNADNKTLTHVLAHEFAHIKRFDLKLTWLMSILCAIHWFNPLLWYCSKLIKRDQELCADAYVMSILSDDDILEYGQTLLYFLFVNVAIFLILCFMVFLFSLIPAVISA